MMRSGALGEYVELEPMSPFKWHRLAETVLSEDVANVASRAVKNHQYEQNFNMPRETRKLLHREAGSKKGQSIRPRLTNPLLNKKLDKIYATQRRSEECSKETLDVLGIIIANCQAILSEGISTRLVIRLGNYIRINQKKIDFAKVNQWLRDLQMHRVAQLLGSILITNFAFRQEEVPFVKKVDPKAAIIMMHSIMNRKKERQRRGFTYFEYAPMENASIILGRLKNRLETIEE